MTSISLLDYAMFLTETRESPRHVAGLSLFDPPQDGGKDFVARLVEDMRAVPPCPPFTWKLGSRLGALPVWLDTEPDMKHHVRHLAVPRPGGYNELMKLVSDLHGELLDRSRPVWEFYIIEGLPEGQIAFYSKVHHAYADGATMSRWLDQSLSADPRSDKFKPMWSIAAAAGRRRRQQSLTQVLEEFGKTAGRQLISVAELYTMLLKHSLKALRLSDSKVPIPFTAPRTMLNQKLTAPRNVATAMIDLERLRRAGKAAGGTINDVVLTLCDAALTRYLSERGELPSKPLVAEMPVDLRAEQHEGGGNVISILLVEMARGNMDVRERFAAIRDSSHTVIKEFSGLSNDAVMTYTLVVQVLAQLGDSLGLADRLPPLGNLVISNVPGPRHPLYLRGARMTGIFPISTVAPGTVMNITVFSYAGKLMFGLVAGRDAIPDLQQLTAYIPESLAELEQSLGLADKVSGDKAATSRGKSTAAKKSAKRKTGSKKRSATPGSPGGAKKTAASKPAKTQSGTTKNKPGRKKAPSPGAKSHGKKRR